MKLREIFSYKPLVVVTVGNNVDWQAAYPTRERLIPKRGFQVGIEVETENFSLPHFQGQFVYPHSQFLWKLAGDPSLRNNGIELQSFPSSERNLALVLDFLDRINKVMKPEYNDRTGIHVHLNVRDMSVEQWMSLIALYVLYEPALFQFSGGREQNIYCVPLRSGTHALPRLFSSENFAEEIVYTTTRGGSKYMALNYLPTAKQTFGTVEFRHMVGTADVEWIKRWIDLIQYLRAGANAPISKLLPRIYEISEKNYEQFTKDIFFDDAGLVTSSNLWNQMREGVILLKQWGIRQESYEEYIEDVKKVPLKPRKTAKEVDDAFARWQEHFRMVEAARFAQQAAAQPAQPAPAPQQVQNVWVQIPNQPIGAQFIIDENLVPVDPPIRR